MTSLRMKEHGQHLRVNGAYESAPTSSSVDLAPSQAKLGSLKLGYAGQVVARGLSLVNSMVGLAWPRMNKRDFSRSFVS